MQTEILDLKDSLEMLEEISKKISIDRNSIIISENFTDNLIIKKRNQFVYHYYF